MYGLPSPHNSESSSAYIKEEDKNQCGCKLIYESLFQHNKEASNARIIQEEWERKRACPSHTCFLYNKCPMKTTLIFISITRNEFT